MKTIAWVLDERLSRDRAKRLTSLIQRVRATGITVEIIPGDIGEAQQIEAVRAKLFTAVLVPAARYLGSAKWDAVFGANFKTAPPIVGYHCEELPTKDLAPAQGRNRLLLLDLTSGTDETLRLISSLADENTRSGILPLLDSGTTIHVANWGPLQSVGAMIDEVPLLSAVAKTDWARRTPAIRSALTGLWSLVYEHGAGKASANLQGAAADVFRAQLQVGVDAQTLVFRLITPVTSGQQAEFLRNFWPAARSQFHPTQILTRDCDFVRVLHWQDTSLTEVTVGLFSAPAGELPTEASTPRVRTLLLDTIPERAIVERPLDLTSLPPYAKTLGSAGSKGGRTASDSNLLPSMAKRFLSEASAKIRQLRSIISDKDAIIQELRSGGVGTAQALPPLEPEDLLESFQERYFQAKLQIRQFEVTIHNLMNKPGTTPQEVEAVRLRMERLIKRQESWIRAIHLIVEQGKERKKAGQ